VRTFEGITCGRFERDNQTELRVITGKRVDLVLAMAAVQTTDEDSTPPCGTDNKSRSGSDTLHAYSLHLPTLVFHTHLRPPLGIDYPPALLHKVRRRSAFRLSGLRIQSRAALGFPNLSRNRSTSRLTPLRTLLPLHFFLLASFPTQHPQVDGHN